MCSRHYTFSNLIIIIAGSSDHSDAMRPQSRHRASVTNVTLVVTESDTYMLIISGGGGGGQLWDQ